MTCTDSSRVLYPPTEPGYQEYDGFCVAFGEDNLFVVRIMESSRDIIMGKLRDSGRNDEMIALESSVENPEDKRWYQLIEHIRGPFNVDDLSVDINGNVLYNGDILWQRGTPKNG